LSLTGCAVRRTGQLTPPLEVHAHAEREEVAVDQHVVVAIEEIGVGQAGGVGVLVLGIQTDTERLGILVEQTVRAITIDVVGERQVRLQVDAGEDVVVVGDGAQAIAPGVGGDETMPAVGSQRGSVGRRTEVGVAAIA